MKKNKYKVVSSFVIAVILFFAFCRVSDAGLLGFWKKDKEHNEERHDEGGHGARDEQGEHDEHEEAPGHVELDKEMQDTIGLTTGKAEFRNVESKIRVYGAVSQDADTYTNITSDESGIVEDVNINSGTIISETDILMTIRDASGTLKEIKSPHHGTIIAVHAKPGDRVDVLKSLLSLAYLDELRVSFDVYEKDLRFVSIGQKVEVKSIAFPDNVFSGEVVYMSPRIDSDSQTIKIRAEVGNPDHLLRLGMFVTGDLISVSDKMVLSVPRMAVQRMNEEDIVFIVDGEDFFVREVRVGREFGEYVEITEGLTEGEPVVVNGSFALKAELAKGSFGDGHNH